MPLASVTAPAWSEYVTVPLSGSPVTANAKVCGSTSVTDSTEPALKARSPGVTEAAEIGLVEGKHDLGRRVGNRLGRSSASWT